MNIYKDYQIVKNILYKPRLIEKTHLLHKFGDVPAIDAMLWDSNPQLIGIVIQTDKRKFVIKAKDFNEHKKSLDYGYGKQYFVEIDK